MEIATMTDAAMIAGTESYYLWHIYVVLLLILALIGVSFRRCSAALTANYQKERIWMNEDKR